VENFLILKKSSLKLKVLFVCSGNSKFGISPFVRSQGYSLNKKYCHIEYFEIKEPGIKGYLKNVFLLRKFLSINKYDVIHAHYGLSGLVALFAKKNEKIVVSFMGDDLIGTVKRSNGRHTIMGKIFISLNKYLCKYIYDFVIVKSKQMYLILDDVSNGIIIPNGVDLNIFYPINKFEARKKLKISCREIFALFVGNPSRKEKNFSLAISSIKAFNSQKNYKIKIRTVFNMSQERLNYYYNAADFLFLTSFHEGSPNVIKEAMSCNCPIVSTNVGDVKWVIGETIGCFISSFSPVDVAKKIELVLDFAKNGRRTSGRAQIANLGLDLDSVAKKIHEVYKNVITI
jgi:glycosyltransferase involved in cell wall biosynthesis